MNNIVKKQKYAAVLDNYASDILSFETFKEQKKYIQHGKISVYEHEILVAMTCLAIVDKFDIKVDKRSLVRGALLHDYFLYDWHDDDPSHRLHGFTHAERALKNASNDFELNDIEKDMIYCHMFPLNISRVPKYNESLILCVADKISALKETIANIYLKIVKYTV